MDSRTFSVTQIFQDRRQYRVPFYQRPYVWNRDDQWERLWNDIQDKADSRLSDGRATPHFMGAVVLEPQHKSGLIGVERHHIIDGQQRLTTLQYVLTALLHTLHATGSDRLIPLIEGCLYNSNPETMEDKEVERFKLWPTFRDRVQYVQAMTASSIDELRLRFPDSFTKAGSIRKQGINHPPALEAIVFFYDQMLPWVTDTSESNNTTDRAMALATAILSDLSIVCISLGEEDDAQIIFETLNGSGAKLHATDLIRNFIFMRAGTDADDLYVNLWSQFEAPLWSENQSRGRLNKPRLEWFVQTAVQAQTGEELDIGRLYAGYRRFVDSERSLKSAAAQLEMLNQYGDHYKSLVTGAGTDAISTYGRSVAVWDASPTHALALRVATSLLSQEEQCIIFRSLESYLIRRAVCGLTKKNYNKVFSQLLRKMIDGSLNSTIFRQELSILTGDASRWPNNEEFSKHWLEGSIYPGRLDAPKLRHLFQRLETVLRSSATEEPVPLALESLDIDHILPQTWYTHWPLPDDTTASPDEAERVRLNPLAELESDPRTKALLTRINAVPKLGNLTLVHLSVNRSLQNHPFAEKRKAFFEHSHLQLNRDLMQRATWDEKAITERGRMLLDAALKIWNGPL